MTSLIIKPAFTSLAFLLLAEQTCDKPTPAQLRDVTCYLPDNSKLAREGVTIENIEKGFRLGDADGEWIADLVGGGACLVTPHKQPAEQAK